MWILTRKQYCSYMVIVRIVCIGSEQEIKSRYSAMIQEGENPSALETSRLMEHQPIAFVAYSEIPGKEEPA